MVPSGAYGEHGGTVVTATSSALPRTASFAGCRALTMIVLTPAALLISSRSDDSGPAADWRRASLTAGWRAAMLVARHE